MMKKISFLLAGLFGVTAVFAGRPENAGHFAVSTNPLALIIHAKPVALDLRTGRIVHEFRYCMFGAQNTNTLYAAALAYRDRQGKAMSMHFDNGVEYSYFMKFLLGGKNGYPVDDDHKFISFYLGLGFNKAAWKMSSRSFTAADKDGINQFTFTDRPLWSTKTWEAGYGIIFFPKRGFFMDARFMFGIRSTRLKFFVNDPNTGTAVTIDKNVFYDPEYTASDFQQGHNAIYAMGLIRFGFSF